MYKFWKLRKLARRVCPFSNRLLCEGPCYHCGLCIPLTGCMGCIRPDNHKRGRCRDLEHKFPIYK